MCRRPPSSLRLQAKPRTPARCRLFRIFHGATQCLLLVTAFSKCALVGFTHEVSLSIAVSEGHKDLLADASTPPQQQPMRTHATGVVACPCVGSHDSVVTPREHVKADFPGPAPACCSVDWASAVLCLQQQRVQNESTGTRRQRHGHPDTLSFVDVMTALSQESAAPPRHKNGWMPLDGCALDTS